MEGEEVVLFADTFNRYFEPDNLRDAETVLRRAGFAVVAALPADADRQGSRPLCCGRTFLAAGLVEAAKAERSEEHTSALQSLMRLSYSVFCLQKQHTPAL